jgi:hypothetical protein
MKKTAVEWLLNEISSTTILDKEDIKLFEQAKEMEKQHMKSIWSASDKNMHRQFSSSAYKPISFEEYYNETFNKKQVNYDTSFNKWEVNALLISKAPEMLEMLVKSLEITNNVIHPKIDHFRNSLRELIKEATEL